MHSHQRVRLLLLLEDGRGRLVDLWRVSRFHLSAAINELYIFVVTSSWVPAIVLVHGDPDQAAGTVRAYLERSTFGLVWSGSADIFGAESTVVAKV